MARPFLRFEDGKITLNNKNLLVNSATLSISPSLQEEKVYGDYDPEIGGARTEFVNFAPASNLKGQLNISFYISSDIVSPNNVDRLFELIDVVNPDNPKTTISEDPIHGNIVGRCLFDNMYLTSFSFEMRPFEMIVANASYDIYGTIYDYIDRYFRKTDVDFAHSMKSFGEVKIGNQVSDEEFQIKSLKYNVSVKRKTSNRIRENEQTAVNTSASGATPGRVSIESISAEAIIDCNNMIPNLNSYGDQQLLSAVGYAQNSVVDVFMYSLGGERLSRFQCSGKIQNQNLSIAEGSHASNSLTIRQVIK